MNEERLHSPAPEGARLIAAIKGHVPHLLAKHGAPGLNIALADGRRLIWEAGFGLADIATKRPMACDSTYHSGSLGKVYTATAVMILADRGVIALDDPINKHLPFEVHNPLGARDITIRDLLVHKPGLSMDAAGSQWAPGLSLEETVRAEYAKEFSPLMGGAVRRWIAPVGSVWCYSNLGLATLGLIVERANPQGLGFSEFVQREIMDPLGMKFSQYPIAQHADHVRPDIWALASTGYSRMGKVLVPSFPLCFGEYPAGGIMARPADHVRLLLAMMNGGELEGHRLFSEATAREMISPATEMAHTPEQEANLGGAAFEQGLIWRLNDVGKPYFSFDHSGGHMWGWRTQGRAWPAQGVAVMAAANNWTLPDDHSVVDEMMDFVGTWVRHRPPVDIDAKVSIDAAPMSFIRGALLALTYRAIGVQGDVPAAQWAAVQAGACSLGSDWDGEAFRRGFEAAAVVPQTTAAMRAFWTSGACEVDVGTVKTALAAMAAREPGSFAALLPD